MKRAGLLLAIALLGACAGQPAVEPGFNDPAALPYVMAHGVSIDVQVPREGFVGAAMVIDAKTAAAASQTSDSVARGGAGAGLIGLLVVSAINSRIGAGALERDARENAQKDARPMADLLANEALGERLRARYRLASQTAGLAQAQGSVSARLLIEPHLVLSADRDSFVLISRVQVQDIAGSTLYRRRIAVVGQTLRSCGAQCIDDGRLELNKVNDQLQQCIDETLRTLLADLQAGEGVVGEEQTVRYVLDGHRVVERGRLLPGTGLYHRYRDLDGALKSVPAPFEGIAAGGQ
ncbi:MAG: hypothetical protein PW845_28140 [Pseudomonas sp.]|uniref:hypothetical protein n=1 Tax=Pseudomonas abieticivorans TaxID=2931382 RepID=UPI0020BED0A9|nr:hypothetical protein [Pseudomonas sp. PIA16]MDE1169150.1 hypothetical protein [Pseudomonas sp.]